MLTELCTALSQHQIEEVLLLTFLQKFSSKEFRKDSTDNRKKTILHHVAHKADNGVLRGLLKANADLNKLDKDQCTPLCIAIREENVEGARLLIEGGADVNLGGGIYGSPLHLATVKNHTHIVRLLLQKGASVDRIDQYGNTCLHMVMNVYSKDP